MGVTVQKFYEAAQKTLSLEVVSGGEHMERTIPEQALNRPGLALAGFFQYFAHRRIQVIGLAENTYLKSLSEKDRTDRVRKMFEKHIPCVVITRNRTAYPEFIDMCTEFRVPILKTPMITSHFINGATITMERLASPRMRMQGTMLDIQGIGVLIEGEPGIGKSETALALIERGHSLVADDITVIRRDYTGVVMASAVDITRYHMEIRGLGIIHVPSIFGVASMRDEKRLDLIVRLQRPGPDWDVDRTGLAPKMRDVMDVRIPYILIPVAPGRDMANVVEVAALNQKLKHLGHDAAKELDEKLVHKLSGGGLE
ncbi:MAG: HPr(Ser) kinase/phosphatase [Verrucomicrobia bacterium]|nr:HPr(Ser) kinase/phosphatase [Verrucomicrobiota bacterium]